MCKVLDFIINTSERGEREEEREEEEEGERRRGGGRERREINKGNPSVG